MDTKSNSEFILHVSDFHLNNNKKDLEYAFAALEALVGKLQSEHIKIDYLLYTGDIINSSDLHEKVASELKSCRKFYDSKREAGKRFDSSSFNERASSEVKAEFNQKLREFAKERFSEASNIMKRFISRLNISLGNVVICCGNHDVLRLFYDFSDKPQCIENGGFHQYKYRSEVNEIFTPFEDFLDDLETANSRKRCHQSESVIKCTPGNLNILILNTNWENPENMKSGYYCVHCEQIRAAVSKSGHNSNKLNVILAHKPIYEICETARLSYKRYIKTQFMAALQEFIGENGIYLCGDKHTRSIVGSFFHDIPHYIGGEPLTITNQANPNFDVEYNLLEVVNGKLGMERKIHLQLKKGKEWECNLRPQDDVVSKLYNFSKDFFVDNVLEMIAKPELLLTWENVCQEIYGWTSDRRKQWYQSLDEVFKAICKYRKFGSEDMPLGSDKNIFELIQDSLKVRINEYHKGEGSNNLLNVRGEYSSGKSTFLGLLYIYLLHEYAIGSIDFIPAYFNLENKKVLGKIQSGAPYHDAAEQIFAEFTNNIQKITGKEHQSICYIVDGLDEQDCWSYSSEDSIGRGILDVLSNYNNVYYIMAFSQHRLPRFKNTMPLRTFNDTSDIIYFNPIDVRENGSDDNRFSSFIDAFMRLNNSSWPKEPPMVHQDLLDAECNIIRKFRRLTINPGFMYHNYKYLTATAGEGLKLKYEKNSVAGTYGYFIDRQYEMCLQSLGYGFVHYAPAMAFLFSYCGYTYEQFKQLSQDDRLKSMPTLDPICENHNKVYDTFLFIKKHNDAREYLIALHYNRELRYYAEHPDAEIATDSVLNEYITRNIAVLIRKLWSDTNKFVIVCEKLLQRKVLSNCVQSMLIYCLAHQDMYGPLRQQLSIKMIEKGNQTLSTQQWTDRKNATDEWTICGKDDIEKLKCFVDLSLKHTMKIYSFMKKSDLIRLFIYDKSFCAYNRQHQMLYYGDLSIRGEDRRHLLYPGIDIVNKGFDFHNCFNYLYVKLNSNHQYPLRTFDMCTMWDLICSRLSIRHPYNDSLDTFFFRDAFREKADMVLEQAFNIFDRYIFQNNALMREEQIYFRVVRCLLKNILDIRKDEDVTNHAARTKEVLKGFDDCVFWDYLLKQSN